MKSMKRSTKAVVLAGVVVAMVLAGVVSFYASASPDGLNRVAIDKGFDAGEKPHDLDNSPLSGYSVRGVDNERLSGGLAGIAGVGMTFLAAAAVALIVRRRRADSASGRTGPDDGAPGGSA